MKQTTAPSVPTTHIISNGSKWAGEPVDPVEKLLAVLQEHPLDRLFESYGNYIFKDDDGIPGGTTRFWGNFLSISHVFQIDTNDLDVIARLTTAIRANQQRPDFLAQPNAEQRRAADEAAQQAIDARRQASRRQRLQTELAATVST